MTALLFAGKLICAALIVYLFPGLLPRLNAIAWWKRLLWWCGALMLFLLPCMADDIFKTKELYAVSMALAVVYMGLTISILTDKLPDSKESL